MKFFSINAKPGKVASIVLPFLPFLVCLIIYFCLSTERHRANPDEKLVPTITQIANAFLRYAFTKENEVEQATKELDQVAVAEKEGQDGNWLYRIWQKIILGGKRFKDWIFQYRLWADTIVSSLRFFAGLLMALPGILIGLHIGTMPYLNCLFSRFSSFLDKIPPIVLLPLLFVYLGANEQMKIILICISILSTVVLDTALRARAVPREQIIRAQTLGASNCEIIYRIIFRQIIPKVLDNLRLTLKAVIQLLIMSETISSMLGLGFRMFLVRRYLAMDVIIAYVIWISFLVFLLDRAIIFLIRKRYPWVDQG